jgi:hypothetical protein
LRAVVPCRAGNNEARSSKAALIEKPSHKEAGGLRGQLALWTWRVSVYRFRPCRVWRRSC